MHALPIPDDWSADDLYARYRHAPTVARFSHAGQHPAASDQIHGKPSKSLECPQIATDDRWFRVDLGVAGCQQEPQSGRRVQCKGRDLPLPFDQGLRNPR